MEIRNVNVLKCMVDIDPYYGWRCSQRLLETGNVNCISFMCEDATGMNIPGSYKHDPIILFLMSKGATLTSGNGYNLSVLEMMSDPTGLLFPGNFADKDGDRVNSLVKRGAHVDSSVGVNLNFVPEDPVGYFGCSNDDVLNIAADRCYWNIVGALLSTINKNIRIDTANIVKSVEMCLRVQPSMSKKIETHAQIDVEMILTHGDMNIWEEFLPTKNTHKWAICNRTKAINLMQTIIKFQQIEKLKYIPANIILHAIGTMPGRVHPDIIKYAIVQNPDLAISYTKELVQGIPGWVKGDDYDELLTYIYPYKALMSLIGDVGNMEKINKVPVCPKYGLTMAISHGNKPAANYYMSQGASPTSTDILAAAKFGETFVDIIMNHGYTIGLLGEAVHNLNIHLIPWCIKESGQRLVDRQIEYIRDAGRMDILEAIEADG